MSDEPSLSAPIALVTTRGCMQYNRPMQSIFTHIVYITKMNFLNVFFMNSNLFSVWYIVEVVGI